MLAKTAAYKYYVIRVSNMAIIRRTLTTLKRVKSSLYSPGTQFALVQLTYTGGKVVGSLPIKELALRTKIALNQGGCSQISRELYKALKPFMTQGE